MEPLRSSARSSAMFFVLLLLVGVATESGDDRVTTSLDGLSQGSLIPCDDATKPDLLITLSKVYMHKGDVNMALTCAELGVSLLSASPRRAPDLTTLLLLHSLPRYRRSRRTWRKPARCFGWGGGKRRLPH